MDTWDDSSTIRKVMFRAKPYTKLGFHALKNGVPIKNLIRAQFPLLLKDAKTPPHLRVSLTNKCNLKCKYCFVAHSHRGQGHMKKSTFHKLIENIKELKTKRVFFAGGEPTIHPEFIEFCEIIKENIPFPTIISNGQWSEPYNYNILLNTFSLIEISVECGNEEMYETQRLNGSFIKLRENIINLWKQKQQLKSNAMIQIRLMIHPSNQNYKKHIKYWKKYSDSVLLQKVIQKKNMEMVKDAYIPKNYGSNKVPICTHIFKYLHVFHNGDVPICGPSERQTNPKEVLLGNINNDKLIDLWNSTKMKQQRNAHRFRKLYLLNVCKGCDTC